MDRVPQNPFTNPEILVHDEIAHRAHVCHRISGLRAQISSGAVEKGCQQRSHCSEGSTYHRLGLALLAACALPSTDSGRDWTACLNRPSSNWHMRKGGRDKLHLENFSIFNTHYNTSALTGDKTNMGCSFQLTSGLST